MLRSTWSKERTVASELWEDVAGGTFREGESLVTLTEAEYQALVPRADAGDAKAPYHIGVDNGDAEGARCVVTILEEQGSGPRRLVYSGEVDVDEHGAWHFTDAKNEEAGK